MVKGVKGFGPPRQVTCATGPEIKYGGNVFLGDLLEENTFKKEEVKAPFFLKEALKALEDRAASRDCRESGERSMEKTVKLFNELTGCSLSEEQGWMFMVMLKIVRSAQGEFRADDYTDLSAYGALMGEAANKARR